MSSRPASTSFPRPKHRFARLDHLGHLAVTGADAVAFLQTQLTQDVVGQPADTARLSGYCQAKGRLLATFLQWTTVEADGQHGVRLQLTRELAPAIAKRLSMYVLRAKVQVADVSDQYVTFGVIGAGVDEWPQASLGLARIDDAVVVTLGDAADDARHVVVVPAGAVAERWQAQLAELASEVDAVEWRRAEICAGWPRLVAATQERFVPQMINFEVVGGVDFKKGCYPGQEVVARSQYLGKLRRRMFLASLDAPGAAAAGDDVVLSGREVGYVVNAERSAEGGADLLIEIAVDAQADALTVNGAALRLLALPYPLPREPVEPARAAAP